MKSVLISIHPKWCELIASGKKTVEVRKTKPKLKTPFKVYIYCTKDFKPNVKYGFKLWAGRGKVIGEFVCDHILGHCEMANADLAEQQGCVRREDISQYSNGKEVFGWHISDLVIYDAPKPLRDFCRAGICPCDAKSILHCTENMSFCAKRNLTRPPQSWCYVEELEDGK